MERLGDAERKLLLFAFLLQVSDGKGHVNGEFLLLLLLWSPSIADDDDFLFNVGNMTQHEEEESMC